MGVKVSMLDWRSLERGLLQGCGLSLCSTGWEEQSSLGPTPGGRHLLDPSNSPSKTSRDIAQGRVGFQHRNLGLGSGKLSVHAEWSAPHFCWEAVIAFPASPHQSGAGPTRGGQELREVRGLVPLHPAGMSLPDRPHYAPAGGR